MQEDSSLDDIYQELKKRQNNNLPELKSELSERFVSDLVRNSNKDISLGEYLNMNNTQDGTSECTTIVSKLIGLLDDLEKETGMEDEIFELEELEELDLSCMTGKARNELEKNLFINHKKKIRQSGDNRIRNYSNVNIKIGKESSMSPLSLKRYNAD